MKDSTAKSSIIVLALVAGAGAFAPQSRSATQNVIVGKNLAQRHRLLYSLNKSNFSFELYSSESSDDENAKKEQDHSSDRRLGFRRMRHIMQQKSKPVTLAVATATSFLSCLPGQSLFKPPTAEASAPIVLRAAKQKEDPPMVQAMNKAKELKKQRSLEEFDALMQKLNDIEDKDGVKAREAYEKQYQAEKEAKAAQKMIDLENLKRDLLDEGKDPNTYLDAEREVFLFEHDVDLEKIPGTPHNEQMIRNFRSRGKNKPTYDSQKYIVKCQVADLKARGVDPLEHFSNEEVIEKTRAIYKMDNKVAADVAKKYEGLMEQYGGRLTPGEDGEVAFLRSNTATKADIQSNQKSKEQLSAEKAAAKKKRAEVKATAKATRMAEKAATQAKREVQKQALAAEKAQAKAASLEEKQKVKDEASKIAAATAVAAVTSAAHMATDSEIAATAGMDFSATAGQEAGSHSEVVSKATGAFKSKDVVTTIKEHATKGNIVKVTVLGAAASYGIKYYQENNPAAKAERQYQLELLMGVSDEEDDDDDDDEFDVDDGHDLDVGPFKTEEKTEAVEKETEPAPPAPEVEPPKPKKKRSSATAPEAPKPKKKFGFFKKKNANDRETDLNALIAPDAEAPEFASLLAKVLTFGAPGRFPVIASMGDMPFDKFDLEKAKEMLVETRSDLDLSDEKSAEVFANVVNCMIIDIVDLASGALKAKEKDDKLAVDAINVVMDFCDHAASLFDAVAQVSFTFNPYDRTNNILTD